MPFPKTSKRTITKREISSITVHKISVCVTDKNGYTNGRAIRALAPSGNFMCQQPTTQLYKNTHRNHKASQVAWQVWLIEELESVLRHVQWTINTSTLDQKSIQNTMAGIKSPRLEFNKTARQTNFLSTISHVCNTIVNNESEIYMRLQVINTVERHMTV